LQLLAETIGYGNNSDGALESRFPAIDFPDPVIIAQFLVTRSMVFWSERMALKSLFERGDNISNLRSSNSIADPSRETSPLRIAGKCKFPFSVKKIKQGKKEWWERTVFVSGSGLLRRVTNWKRTAQGICIGWDRLDLLLVMPQPTVYSPLHRHSFGLGAIRFLGE
jgi:hypothetical protein